MEPSQTWMKAHISLNGDAKGHNLYLNNMAVPRSVPVHSALLPQNQRKFATEWAPDHWDLSR